VATGSLSRRATHPDSRASTLLNNTLALLF
jgi:hypothetical protein